MFDQMNPTRWSPERVRGYAPILSGGSREFERFQSGRRIRSGKHARSVRDVALCRAVGTTRPFCSTNGEGGDESCPRSELVKCGPNSNTCALSVTVATSQGEEIVRGGYQNRTVERDQSKSSARKRYISRTEKACFRRSGHENVPGFCLGPRIFRERSRTAVRRELNLIVGMNHRQSFFMNAGSP